MSDPHLDATIENSSSSVAFFEHGKSPVGHRLIVKSKYIFRHIDVNANLRQLGPNKVKGNCRTERCNIDQATCPARFSKNVLKKSILTCAVLQEAALEQGRVFGVRSLFTLVRKTH